MVKNIPDGFHSITINLTVKNAKQAIEFYKKAFGATELMSVPFPSDGNKIMHAGLKIGDSIVFINDEVPKWCEAAPKEGCHGIGFYLYVNDVDKIFQQAVNAGAEIISQVDEMFWGDRIGNVKDPYGYSWSIATHVKDVTGEEIDLARKKMMASAT